MAYQKILYDITALEMYKRMEAFLKNKLRDEIANGTSPKHGGKGQVRAFNKKYGEKYDCQAIVQLMHYICDQRNKIPHFTNFDSDSGEAGAFSPMPSGVLSFDNFKTFQRKCFKLEEEISSKLGTKFPMGMREIMIPTLKYDMGNAVDIIKHGLLAEFVNWWGKPGHDCLRFADPFAGCPWGDLASACERLEALKNTALGRVYANGNGMGKYLGSSHLVREVAQRRKLDVSIAVSDNDKNARRNLCVSICKYKPMMGFIKDLPKNDGYKILDNNRASQYNLILIDPYSDFLPDAPEEMRAELGRLFHKIKKLTNNPKLFVAFLLFGDEFGWFKEDMGDLSNRAISLRCPEIEGDGEANHPAEILLIGKETANCELRNRLQNFADEANKNSLLNGQKVEFWAGK